MTTPTPHQVGPARAVWLVARRELRARLRARSFVAGTAVSIAVLVLFVLMQSTLFSDGGPRRVGLSGQSAAIAAPLTAQAAALGLAVTTTTVDDVSTGERQLSEEDIDVLVSGSPAAPRVLVRDNLDPTLRQVLDNLVREEVLRAQLASVEDLDPDEVLSTMADARAEVTALTPTDTDHGQRLAVALVIVALLYLALLLYGTMVAHGVVEEKAGRVVEILLATIRPWQLLMGKVVGLGLVGLAQFAVIGTVGLVLAVTTDVLSAPTPALTTLLWGLLWYLLGYLFYATVFAAAGSLVSRQEETQSVLLPVTLTLVLAFVLGFALLTRSPTGTATAVLSLLPPFTPILMPGRIALGVAPAWQIALAILLMLATTTALARLGGRVYARAILKTGPRLTLTQALRD